jgi:hypothetical protein
VVAAILRRLDAPRTPLEAVIGIENLLLHGGIVVPVARLGRDPHVRDRANWSSAMEVFETALADEPEATIYRVSSSEP